MRIWTVLVLVVALLMSACANGFYEDCAALCRGCDIIECGEFCGQLDDRTLDPECADEAWVAWSCIEAIGCDFPLQCQPSVSHTLACGQ